MESLPARSEKASPRMNSICACDMVLGGSFWIKLQRPSTSPTISDSVPITTGLTAR
jgi:hypothetical protein